MRGGMQLGFATAPNLYDIFEKTQVGMRREAHSNLCLYRVKRKKCSARGVISDYRAILFLDDPSFCQCHDRFPPRCIGLPAFLSHCTS